MLSKGIIFELKELDPYLTYPNVRKRTFYKVVKTVKQDKYNVTRFVDTAQMVAQMEEDGYIQRITPLAFYTSDTPSFTWLDL